MTTILALSLLLVAQSDPLATSFANPPAWAKPHTWWHWMAGNVTKAGITADLEAMKFAGIGGAHIFDAGQGIPAGPVAYNSPEWRGLMAHAMSEARRLGLDMTMHNCSGWSSSGGPWVQPDDAMKRVVWSVTPYSQDADGPAHPKLLDPPANLGYYRDIGAYVVQSKPTSENIAAFVGLAGNPGDAQLANWPVVRRAERHLTNPDGTLDLKLPKGNYSILRLGYTLTGAHNVASRPTGDGLEVDKLSARSLDRFLEGGLVPLFQRIGAPVGKTFRTVLIDSYETGFQNWTPAMVEDFRKLRGYDPTPYLPALAGYAVDDPARTQEFLFDYRRTLADLWSRNYSGHFAERLRKYGLQLAVEPYGNGNFDPFTYAKPAGLIMGEYWVGEGQINGSVKQASSVAHVYGHSVVGAESLTASPDQAGWRNQPRQWKPFADRGYAYGINRIIYHRMAHQPWVKGVLPGMTMGPWGSHVDRTNTFWSYMPAWDRYLSRCQYLLQSGLFVADVALFAGEGSPQEYIGQGYSLPSVPKGYDYDSIGLDPLMSLQVRNGRLFLPSGASYRLLALPNTNRMTVALARKIKDLVDHGAVVIGPRPLGSPSLADGPRGDQEVAAVGRQLWDTGKVRNRTVAQALNALKVQPDFWTDAGRILSIHRRIGNTDAYFVASSQRSPRKQWCAFRVSGRVPEIWDPEDGSIADAPVWRKGPGASTLVELPLEEEGSAFVVFRRPDRGASRITQVDFAPANVRVSRVPKLRILKAEYGALDEPGRFVDVTRTVAAAVQGGGVEIGATNDAMGGDPAYLTVKQLRVTYELGGKTTTAVVAENEVFSAGSPTAGGGATPLQIRGNDLEVWQNGVVTLQRSGKGVQTVRVQGLPAPANVAGSWQVTFAPAYDKPWSVTFPSLSSWTENKSFDVRYFSGTATYRKNLNVPPSWLGTGKRVVLDLGDVRELARVRINGKPVAEFWKPPFEVDVTPYVHRGDNTLVVEVTNLWTNRLIGDEQFPDDMGWNGDQLKGWPEWFVKGQPRPEPRRKTFTTWHHNKKDTPLLPSGILGPVLLRPVSVVKLR